jgi:hypothetical protein
MRRIVFAFLTLTACGSRSELLQPEDLDGSVAEDAPTEQDSTVGDADAGEDVIGIDAVEDSPVVDVIEIDVGPPPPECTTDCTTNHECQSTCPPINVGRWCCDFPTGMCYAVPGKHCPHPILDAGFD